MDSSRATELRHRVEDRIQAWRMTVEHQVQTESSILAFGRRGNQSVVLKVIRSLGRIYSQLCASQSTTRLLHGDLHHGSVLLDTKRGWLAIDPKGVVGELEYEVGAALRNPYERPELFAAPARIERRVDRFGRELHLDAGRMLTWAFAQAVLAAVWAEEDAFVAGPDNAWIALANSVRPMLKGTVDA